MFALAIDDKRALSKRLHFTVALILFLWVFEIVNTFFGSGSVYNILAPGIKLTSELPRAAMYIFAIGLIGFLITILLLRWSGERISDLGFRKERLARQLLLGAAQGIAIFILITFLVNPLTEAIFPKNEADSIHGLFANARNIVLMVALSLFKGGFLEEFFRIFALTRFEKVLGKRGLIFALVLSSFTFGLGHAYQGTSGIVSTGLQGCLYALVFLRKRSAFEAVSAHAVFDLVAVALGSLLYYGK